MCEGERERERVGWGERERGRERQRQRDRLTDRDRQSEIPNSPTEYFSVSAGANDNWNEKFSYTYCFPQIHSSSIIMYR